MLLLAFLGVALLSVPLAGGRLRRLAEYRFSRAWTLLAALALQVTIILIVPGWHPALLRGAHVASYVLAGAFLVSNRRIPGMWLVAIGGGLNFAAILANQGVMPASPEAFGAARLLEAREGFVNSAVLANPRLAFLGDVFAIPPPFPLHNVFSPGDVVIALGIALTLHRICRSRLVPSGAGPFAPLMRLDDFRRLWTSQAVSNIGDWTYVLAVATTVAGREGAARILAGLLIAETAPATLGGLVGGPLVDRLRRKWLMVGADVLRAAAVASLLLGGPPGLVHFYAVAVCLGLLRALFQPSLHASLPNLVPRERLVAANALMSGTVYLAVMVGPVLGGLLVGRAGPSTAFAVNALSFGVSAALVARSRIPSPAEGEAEAGGPSTPLRDLAEGIRYSLRTPLVRGVFVVTGMVMLGAAIRSPLEPVFVLRMLGGEPESLGLVGGAWGLGMLLGALGAPAVAGRWSRERVLGGSVAAVGLAVLAASRAASVSPVVVAWLVAGSANAVGTVAYETLLQERTPDRLRGRVIAASEAVLDGAYLTGVLAAGAMGTALGVRGAFAASGLLLLVTALSSRALLGRAAAPGPARSAEAGTASAEEPAVQAAPPPLPGRARESVLVAEAAAPSPAPGPPAAGVRARDGEEIRRAVDEVLRDLFGPR